MIIEMQEIHKVLRGGGRTSFTQGTGLFIKVSFKLKKEDGLARPRVRGRVYWAE